MAGVLTSMTALVEAALPVPFLTGTFSIVKSGVGWRQDVSIQEPGHR